MKTLDNALGIIPSLLKTEHSMVYYAPNETSKKFTGKLLKVVDRDGTEYPSDFVEDGVHIKLPKNHENTLYVVEGESKYSLKDVWADYLETPVING